MSEVDQLSGSSPGSGDATKAVVGNTFTGGARVGWMSASWPLAKLRASAEVLELSVAWFGDYRFQPGDVIEVKKHMAFPLIAQGVRIEHTRNDVAERVIFYSMTSPQRVLDAIGETGFTPGADAGDKPTSRKFPFRIPFVVLSALVWNVLSLLDRPWDRVEEGKFLWGPGTFTAIGLLFVGSLLLKRWAPLQRFALTGPQARERIEKGRKFTALVSGLLFFGGGLAALLAHAG